MPDQRMPDPRTPDPAERPDRRLSQAVGTLLPVTDTAPDTTPGPAAAPVGDVPRRVEPRMVRPFEVVSDFRPAGDQPAAIAALADGIHCGERFQTLLGITGSGKSATMAWTIEQVQRPTLVLAPNKSLAAQLANEFREFFPRNRVEYFVSYYDYYQPEAYIASSDTFIEKDSSVNDEIERLRHAATSSLLTRRDVIVVASVSCIYGLGSPDEYASRFFTLRVGDTVDQRDLLRQLVHLQYERNDMTLSRGKFRVRGDVIEIQPAYEETAVRIELFGDDVEAISVMDPLTGERVEQLEDILIFAKTHYVVSDERLRAAIGRIETELQGRLAQFEAEGKLLEAQRLRMRTEYDLEMLQEMGFCNGVENYSAPMEGRGPGEPPNTLLDYFPKDYLTIIDESHVTIPQLHGQYEGDRSRKETLIEHGFRLPSAADNRPLRFEEWVQRAGQTVFLSATPSKWELEHSSRVVEQIVRPTGLIDPEVVIKPTKGQIDDLLVQINERVTAGERVLVTTLTKKMAEDLTDYLLEMGVRVRYLHSEVDTLQRIELVRDLRLGEFDVLVGINLLREGLDIPEVSLVAILDADKEGFLRSETSLIQMIGRAARNVNGQVVMYADRVTDSMTRAVSETNRRRGLQKAYNTEHGIDPTTVQKAVTDILADLRGADGAPVPGGGRRKRRPGERARAEQFADLPPQDLGALVQLLEDEMHQASADLRFEEAARLRDEVKELKRELRNAGGA
jgi:excinuclease ABC subunit B